MKKELVIFLPSSPIITTIFVYFLHAQCMNTDFPVLTKRDSRDIEKHMKHYKKTEIEWEKNENGRREKAL